MSFCQNCSQANREILAGPRLRWRCPRCGRVEDALPGETLLAFDNISHAHSGNPTLHGDMLAHAGGDPVNKKVKRSCARCKKVQIMSRISLGDDESPFDICEVCATYTRSDPDAVTFADQQKA